MVSCTPRGHEDRSTHDDHSRRRARAGRQRRSRSPARRRAEPSPDRQRRAPVRSSCRLARREGARCQGHTLGCCCTNESPAAPQTPGALTSERSSPMTRHLPRPGDTRGKFATLRRESARRHFCERVVADDVPHDVGLVLRDGVDELLDELDSAIGLNPVLRHAFACGERARIARMRAARGALPRSAAVRAVRAEQLAWHMLTRQERDRRRRLACRPVRVPRVRASRRARVVSRVAASTGDPDPESPRLAHHLIGGTP